MEIDRAVEQRQGEERVENTMDAYDAQARMFPAILTVATPVAGVGIGMLMGGLSDVAEMLAVTGIAAAAAGRIGANYIGRKGKSKEGKIWRAEGGLPTHRMVRHDNNELDGARKQQLHKSLWDAGYELPTAELEAENPEKAKDLWALTIAGIRAEVGADPRAAGKNRQYGFARNTWAMKEVSIWLSIATIATGTGIGLVQACGTSMIGWAVVAIGAVGLVGWCVGVQRKHAIHAGEDYARTLLECASGHRWQK